MRGSSAKSARWGGDREDDDDDDMMMMMTTEIESRDTGQR